MDERKAREAAGHAFAEAQISIARISEPEKTFTSQVLATVLSRPEHGALLSRQASALGCGIGEYLLQQADWVLQDSDSLLGHMSLAEVLCKRCRASVRALTALEEQLQASDAAVSAGFAEMVLSGLAQSDQAQQREFAQHIVQQLQTLAALLRAARPNIGQISDRTAGQSTPEQQNTSSGGGGGGSGEGTPALAAPKPKGFGGGFGKARARRLSGQAEAIEQSVGSHVGVQAAVNVRMSILLPLLPIVYADKEQNQRQNLRYMLAEALLPIAASPLVHSTSR